MKRISKHDGEVIELCWEDGPESRYVRGHTTAEEAKAILDHFYDTDDHSLQDIHAAYLRWSCEPGEDGPRQTSRDYPSPGPGRFRVMRCDKWHQLTDEELEALRVAEKEKRSCSDEVR